MKEKFSIYFLHEIVLIENNNSRVRLISDNEQLIFPI